MESVKFFNWTKKDFTYIWGGKPYTFIAGETNDLDDFAKADRPAIAAHFAKHLAVRELHAKKLQANDPQLGEFMDKAVVDGKQVAPVEEPKKKKEIVSEIEKK